MCKREKEFFPLDIPYDKRNIIKILNSLEENKQIKLF